MLFRRKPKQEQRMGQLIGEVAWLSGAKEEITSADAALQVGAVYSCVRVIAETVATLPCILYRRLEGGGKERATNHPLYPILHESPNPVQDSVQFFEMMTGHAVLRGNAYAYIEFGPAGTEIIPLNPDRMEVKVSADGRYKYYEYRNGAKPQVFKPEEILHIHGLSTDGYKGVSPINLAMKTVNVARKQELYADAMFQNKASPGGVLKHPGKLSEQAAKRLKEDFERKYSGTERSGATMLLEEGMEWQTIGLSNEQAQFIQGRKFSKSDIAMWFRMPPHKIGDLENATFSNIEHQALEFVTDTIRPWLVRWEKALLMKLFTADERKNYAIEFLVDAILRGDTASRYAAYAVGRQWGWLNVDEIRERENMNPLPNGEGKVYLHPLNMVSSDEQTDTQETPEAEPDSPAREYKIRFQAIWPTMASTLERAWRRRAKIAKWDEDTLNKEVDVFCDMINPALRGLGKPELIQRIRDIWLLDEQIETAKNKITALLTEEG